MSLFYRLAYRLGVAPWERAAEHPAAADHIAALLDREQEGREPPYGDALDLGCGSGIWSVDLARRGWRVTGVDLVPKALRRARQRSSAAGVDVRFVEGDVTTLREAEVGAGFRLVWDFGTVHGLAAEQREAVGRGVSEVAEAASGRESARLPPQPRVAAARRVANAPAGAAGGPAPGTSTQR